MARYERDYGRDFGGRDAGYRRQRPPFSGGMRSDGWGGGQDWQRFEGEEGWYGGPGGGIPDRYYDSGYRTDREFDRGQAGGGGLFGGRQMGPEFGPSRGDDYRDRGYGRGREGLFRDRQTSEGWDDRYDRNRGGLFNQGRDRFRAADIMTENPHTVTPEASISDVARRMRDLDVGIIPVVDSEDSRRLKGVITDRDIAVRAVAEGKTGNAKVSECMTDHVRHVNKNDSVQDVMRVMRQEQVRRVPVTDREGRLVGIIAQADLAVDYSRDDSSRESEVEEVLEQVSEPARPRRSPGRMAAGGRKAADQNELST